jgi:hypothetical protein
MRALTLWTIVGLVAGCGATQKLPPGVAFLARYPVATRGVPGGEGMRRIAVWQKDTSGPRVDRAVVDVLQRGGREVALLAPGSEGAEAAARGLRADALLQVRLVQRREAVSHGFERHQVTRPATGVKFYLAPETPTGIPEGVLYPDRAEEKASVVTPVDQQLIDAVVEMALVRPGDGKLVASWRQHLGSYRVWRPLEGAAPASQPQGRPEQETPAWTAVLEAIGGDVRRWIEAPVVAAERPLWRVDRGPAAAATASGLAAARGGQWPAAEASFREAVGLAVNDPRTHANLAVALERRGERDQAHAELRAAARLESNGGVRFAILLHEFEHTFLPAFAVEPVIRQGPGTAASGTAPATAPAP